MLDYLDFKADLSDPELVSAYDELPLWSSSFGALLLKHIPLRRNITALDIGPGTGFPLLELAQRLGPSCTVYGIDPWVAALERARHKAQVWRVANIVLQQGDAATMPFPDATFDLLVSNLGINNFANRAAVLAECRRVAKPGATLALTTNLQGHMREFYQVFEATLRDLGDRVALDALQAHIEGRVSVAGARALLEQAGFRVSRVHEEAAVMRFVDGSAFLRHSIIKLGFLDGWKSVVDPAAQPEVFARLEGRLNQLAEAQGELALTIPMAYIEAQRT
jgi:ubiquinone/menaquinone biosynthesis C-methylase UbiE